MTERARAQGTGRRDLLIGLGLVAAAIGAGELIRSRPATLELEPIPGLPGYLRLRDGGAASGGIDLATFGLDPPPRLPAPDLSRLHRPAGLGAPVAVFTDANCPNCRVFERRLAARDDLSITWHDLPVLGPGSVLAARAAIAGEALGAPELRARLFGTRAIPNEGRLSRIAADLGIDRDRLADAMRAPAVGARLAQDAALADALGIYATPGAVFGTIVAVGALRDAQIEALVREAA